MADDAAGAFLPPDGQSEYAFPASQGQGGPDEADMASQRNQQIQQGFDSQRMQRAFIQGVSSQIDKLSRQQKSSGDGK